MTDELVRYKLITFDVYTALFDIESSLLPAMQAVVAPGIDSLPLVRTWRRKQLEYVLISNSLGRGRVPFWTITKRALDYTLTRAGVELDHSASEQLMACWLHLHLWPEAGAVLATVKARGYRMGLLSNGDTEMLQALADRLPLPVDYVFASEAAGQYKPHPSVYALPTAQLSLQAGDILHVAGSPTDVMGTKAAGLICAWSNRNGERVLDPTLDADHKFTDLTGLLSIV